MSSKVWKEITYPFPIFNGLTVEDWEWISDFIPRFTMDMVIYPCVFDKGIMFQNERQQHITELLWLRMVSSAVCWLDMNVFNHSSGAVKYSYSRTSNELYNPIRLLIS